MNYDAADRAMRDINKRNLRAFGHLKTLKFDELNVMRTVGKVYDDSVRIAKKRFKSVGVDAFLMALLEAGIAGTIATAMAEDSITDDWVLDMLEDYNKVTLYQFTNEVERKKQRTAEAILAAQNKNREVDKALRLWTLQIAQYMDDTVVYATLDAFEEAGIKKVQWITEKDNRVCEDCRRLDGEIFDIDKVPPRQHFRCRCILKPITR